MLRNYTFPDQPPIFYAQIQIFHKLLTLTLNFKLYLQNLLTFFFGKNDYFALIRINYANCLFLS